MLENPLVDPITKSDSKKDQFRKEVLQDFWTCLVSREASIVARREVLTGKAKFGIVGDGKEVPQVAVARAFKKGDWRSGYYRDQTMMFALGLSTLEAFFAQLFADAENDPFSGGRQMNSHFATPSVDKDGIWTNHLESYNVSSDISCTGGQMARGLGLALASKIYRQNKTLSKDSNFSSNGNELCFVTIGDASTSEGVFWETINAAGVQQVPMVISVWDDGYGISVPTEFQTTKGSISEVLQGFKLNKKGEGIRIETVKGWDYAALRDTYEKVAKNMRKDHIPTLVHVQELTQPQGHSTSGSHERYKPKERLDWEKETDCILKMREWILDSGISKEADLLEMEAKAKTFVKEAKNRAWENYQKPIRSEVENIKTLFQALIDQYPAINELKAINEELNRSRDILLGELIPLVRRVQIQLIGQQGDLVTQVNDWIARMKAQGAQRYLSKLYSNTENAALRIPGIPAKYNDDAPLKPGYEILNKFFDNQLENRKDLYAFGEDVGQIGDVNQGFAGLQKKYGIDRVFDTGIREWTIMGQAIGMAMRGLRPIAEIQYLDYLIYGLEPLSDDLATLRYRSNGIQQAPAIIRTRGHRLEGIWHAGSPMGMLINSLRGIYICVPRNMTQAVGFYNTLLKSNDPALVIEVLNGYRLKEQMPENILEFSLPLGVPEVLTEGTDVTLVTYGACIRIAEKAVSLLAQQGISVELIDVQTLLPFDLESRICESLKKTNRIVFLDEDVPGGATAFMMQQVLEVQGGYQYLDAEPKTITAAANRPPYGSDGDYFAKPNPEDIFEAVYQLMRESDPNEFPLLF